MGDLLSELDVELPADPDAQATITDFIDYTEFFPSDLIRSLTLIGKLDESYHQNAQKVHDLTKTYGCLPTLPANNRPEPQMLRKQISATLDHAIRCRESSLAEASRLCESAERLYNRLAGIKKKLQAMPQPPSRDPTPVPQSRSPTLSRVKNEMPPRLALYVDGSRLGTGQPGSGATGRLKHSSRRVIVPGEVLPPLDPNSPGISEGSDYESAASESSRTTPALAFRRKHKAGASRISEASKTVKLKLPKASRLRPPGHVGTNVHSAVAGISTSNAIALLQKPPEDAKPGSKHRPWLKLTEYEMAMLRKKMKKNAIWHPSPTMVRRELASRERGHENYRKAKLRSQETGEEFLDEDPVETGAAVLPEELTLTNLDDMSTINRGMKLNEAKKLKREIQLREQAKLDAIAIEEAGQRIANAGLLVHNLFNNRPPDIGDSIRVNTPTARRDHKLPKKRNQYSSPPAEMDESIELATPAPKRLKIAPPSAPIITVTSKVPLASPAHTPMPRVSISNPKARSTTTSRSTRRAMTPSQAPLTVPARLSRGLTLTLKTPTTTAETPSRRSSLRHTSPSSDSSASKQSAAASTAGRRKASAAADLATTGSYKKAVPGRNKSHASTPIPVLEALEPGEPNEEHYCVCGGVSWGDMIACDNMKCENEWFHFGCVDITELPPRREKWYCPDCRRRMGTDAQGVRIKPHGRGRLKV